MAHITLGFIDILGLLMKGVWFAVSRNSSLPLLLICEFSRLSLSIPAMLY